MPPMFAIGPWLYIAVPLMIVLPVIMITVTRVICGLIGDDSFRLRPERRWITPKPARAPADDAF